MSAALLTLAVELRLRVDGCTCGLLWLTDVDPASPAFSASFTVPANASPDGLRARHADLLAALAIPQLLKAEKEFQRRQRGRHRQKPETKPKKK